MGGGTRLRHPIIKALNYTSLWFRITPADSLVLTYPVEVSGVSDAGIAMVKMRVLIFILCTLFLGQAQAEQKVTFAFWQAPSEAVVWRWAELVYSDAFSRLGIQFDYIVYPPARASIMANCGDIDGEPARIKSYGDLYPNLIRVDEVVSSNKVAAYAVTPGIVLEGWESLSGTDYRVEYYLGMAFAKSKLTGLVAPDRLSSISVERLGLKKLILKRTDLYIDSMTRIEPLLSSAEFSGSGVYVAGIMMDLSGYPYLHKRHSLLVPKLADVLKQMKAEGAISRYLKQAKQELQQ